MQSHTRVLVLLLCLLLVAFGGILLWGSHRSDNSSDSAPSWLEAVDGALVVKSPVRPTDIMASCFDGNRLLASPRVHCEALVRSSAEILRTMTIRMSAGSTGHLTLQPRGSDGATVSVDLNSSNPRTPELQVLRDGATLTLDCAGPASGGPCQFVLEK